MLVCVTSLLLSAQSMQKIQFSPKDEQKHRLSKVFVNATGDAKLSHRLWTYMGFEFEDIGVTLANTEADADAIVNAHVTEETVTQRLGLGLTKLWVTAGDRTEELDSCESLSTDEAGELFNQAAEEIAGKIRSKYTAAKTLMLASDSDLQMSKAMRVELPAQLKESGFTLVERAPADVILRIRLVRLTPSIELREAKYSVTLASRENIVSSLQGNVILYANPVGAPPGACPDRIQDLGWMYGVDSLFRVAQTIARDLYKRNADLVSVGSNALQHK